MRQFLAVSLALVVLLVIVVALLPAPVSVPTASAATNTVLNPGFEEPSGGSTTDAPSNWTPATTTPFRGNATSSDEGSFSAYLHGTSGSYTQTVNIGADTTYRFEANTRATSTATEFVTLEIRNSSGVVLDTFPWNGTDHGWARRETYLATPTNAWDAVITLSISGEDSSAGAWFDDIVLVQDTASYCFIATAAYGSGSDSHVETLRSFRDHYMAPNDAGSALVATYYKISPPVARFIDDHPSLKPAVKAGLLPSIGLSSMAMSTTPVEKAAMAGAMLALSGLAALCLRRRALARRS